MIEWWRDPAASGWRSRALVPDEMGGGELIAYDDGDWEVRLGGFAVAGGREPCGHLAQERAIIVHEALTRGRRTTSPSTTTKEGRE